MPSIEYDHDDFPPGKLAGSGHHLTVTWDEILWAAITVGRPNLYHVLKYGQSSIYEAIFRWSLMRMSLEQRGALGTRFYRTAAFKNMDPTEKGAVNYFLGLVICKLFATKLLNAPWCLHLDIWRQVLNPVLLKGRSRPDMVAQSASTSEWYAFECKGRASVPGESEKVKAKAQAKKIVSVGGTNCALHVGSITYFRGDTLKFYWRDPEPPTRKLFGIPSPDDAWREYYEPFTETYLTYQRGGEQATPDLSVSIPQLDITLKIHPMIAESLLTRDWQNARGRARELGAHLREGGYQPDGLKVIAGDSWRSRFEEKVLVR